MGVLNIFDLLQHVGSDEYDEASETIDVNPTYSMMSCNENVANIKQRGLRIGNWKFQGLCNDRKILKVGEILRNNRIHIIGGQVSWELDHSEIYVLVISGLASLGRALEVSMGRVG